MSELVEGAAAPADLRTSRLVRGIATSLVARGATALSPLLLIPITLEYLGAAQYGVWMAITSITSMFLWADLGLGNGLLTRLTPMVANGQWKQGRIVVATAYLAVTVVAFVGAVLSLATFWVVPWGKLLNAEAAGNARLVTTICLVTFFINVPAALVHRLYFSMQRIPTSNLIQVIGSGAAVIGAAITVSAGSGPTVVILSVVTAPVAVNLIASVWFFASRPELRPASVRAITDVRPFLLSGAAFLGVSILTALAMNSDNLIVAHASSVSAVASFSVEYRLFAALGLVVTVMNLPLWPANAEALAKGDHVWVVRTTRRMTAVSGGAVMACGCALVLLRDPIFDFLAGGISQPSVLLAVGFAALWSLLAFASPLFMVQNSIGVLRPQLVGWAIFLILSVPAKILVANCLGIEWIPIAAAAIYATSVLPAAWVGYQRALAASMGRCVGTRS